RISSASRMAPSVTRPTQPPRCRLRATKPPRRAPPWKPPASITTTVPGFATRSKVSAGTAGACARPATLRSPLRQAARPANRWPGASGTRAEASAWFGRPASSRTSLTWPVSRFRRRSRRGSCIVFGSSQHRGGVEAEAPRDGDDFIYDGAAHGEAFRALLLLLAELDLAGHQDLVDTGHPFRRLHDGDVGVHPLLERGDVGEGGDVDGDDEMAVTLRTVEVVVEIGELLAEGAAGEQARQDLAREDEPPALVPADWQDPAAVLDPVRIVRRPPLGVHEPSVGQLHALLGVVEDLAARGHAERRIEHDRQGLAGRHANGDRQRAGEWRLAAPDRHDRRAVG